MSIGVLGLKAEIGLIFILLAEKPTTYVPEAGILVMAVVCTVSMSVFTHGLTANPLAFALGARIECLKR